MKELKELFLESLSNGERRAARQFIMMNLGYISDEDIIKIQDIIKNNYDNSALEQRILEFIRDNITKDSNVTKDLITVCREFNLEKKLLTLINNDNIRIPWDSFINGKNNIVHGNLYNVILNNENKLFDKDEIDALYEISTKDKNATIGKGELLLNLILKGTAVKETRGDITLSDGTGIEVKAVANNKSYANMKGQQNVDPKVAVRKFVQYIFDNYNEANINNQKEIDNFIKNAAWGKGGPIGGIDNFKKSYSALYNMFADKKGITEFNTIYIKALAAATHEAYNFSMYTDKLVELFINENFFKNVTKSKIDDINSKLSNNDIANIYRYLSSCVLYIYNTSHKYFIIINGSKKDYCIIPQSATPDDIYNIKNITFSNGINIGEASGPQAPLFKVGLKS
jgi:hypothetical protein